MSDVRIRVLAPTGRIGFVPEANLQAALDAGAKLMTADDMRELRQQIFMEHGVFQQEHRRPAKPRKRRSIVRSSRTR